jgi:hypothetical protein
MMRANATRIEPVALLGFVGIALIVSANGPCLEALK